MLRIKKLFTTTLFICLCLSLSAQKLDSALNVYAEKFQQEKIHIHFDKSIYNKGETIWMKVYLMAGSDFSSYSKNIYIDWFGADGKLIKHTVAPVFESTAKFEFTIPDSYTANSIHAVAYTRWMLNFDSAFLFNKEIPVTQLKPLATSNTASIRTIHFFPEGGDLVNGLQNRVAFKANDQLGKPVQVIGAVKTSSGAWVDSFASEHDGMGVFSITPKKNETYLCYWMDETGETHTTALPASVDAGVNLEIQSLSEKTLVAVKRTAVVTDNLKTLNLVATMNQQLFYRSKINFTAKASVLAQIPTGDLPSGVVIVTLFDQNWVPIAERALFVNNHQHQFNPRVSFPVASLSKRAKNVIEIDVPDTVSSNLSIAVTDASIISDSSTNIISQFLLSGDIKGSINNPAYYFSNNSDSVARHLDLVMLTHGWRRFKWDEIAAGKLPQLTYQPETDYVMIKGKVFGSAFEKLVTKPSINMFLQAKDSTRKLLSLPIDRDASFSHNNGIFFDTLQVRYMFNGDRKLTDLAEIRFQNGLLPELAVSTNFLHQSVLWNNFSDSSGLKKIRMMLEEQDRLAKLRASVTLKDVVVRSKAKSAVQILDEKYAKGLFAGGDGMQFDIANDLIAQSAMSVFNYLQGRVAGLTINFNGNDPSVKWRNSTTDLFLNESPIDANMLYNIPMTDVAYIKVMRPPFFGAFGGGAGGAIAVYTRNGTETRPSSNNGTSLPKSFVAGYTPYKEFYSPDYTVPQPFNDPDMRTTLYWNPYVFTDPKNHKVRLSFFNNDSSKKLRVIIEGVNADGKLARVEKIIE